MSARPQHETVVLQRGADGVYRLPQRPRQSFAYDPADLRTTLLAYAIGDDGRLFTKEWIA